MSPPTAAPAWLDAAAATADAAPADRVPLTPAAPPKLKPRPGVAPPPAAAPVDNWELARRGYDPWTLLPSTAVLLALTVAAPLVATPYLPVRIWVEAIIAPLAALWLVQVFRCGYRMMAFDYRVTARRLEVRRGRLYEAVEPLDLATVARVAVRRWPFGWLTNTGTVRVVPEDVEALTVELTGVYRPREFAAAIEGSAQTAREGNIIATKVSTASQRT